MNPTILRRKRTAAVLAFLLVSLSPGVPAPRISRHRPRWCASPWSSEDTYYLAPGSEVHASIHSRTLPEGPPDGR